MAVSYLFIHSPVDGHMGYFLGFVIVDKVSMNACVQIFTWTYIFICFGKYLGTEWPGCMVGVG